MLIETNAEEMYIVDRNYSIKRVWPKFSDYTQSENSTIKKRIINIFDGELIIDAHDPTTPKYLIFDACLVQPRDPMT